MGSGCKGSRSKVMHLHRHMSPIISKYNDRTIARILTLAQCPIACAQLRKEEGKIRIGNKSDKVDIIRVM